MAGSSEEHGGVDIPQGLGATEGKEAAGRDWIRVIAMGLVGGGLIVLGVAAAVAASMASKSTAKPTSTSPFAETAMLLGGHSFLCLEVADTPEARVEGLSGRSNIGAFDGMIFLFPDSTPSEASFWMKDTYFPLDLIFVGLDGRVADVRTMAPCERDDCPLYSPHSPYLFAIELPAGHAEQFGLVRGVEVRLGGGCVPIDRD
ncbi:MAG: hypothetical protein C4318_01025 [Acidimicrobiia bacterium]